MVDSPAIPDRIETEQYSELLRLAEEKLMESYPRDKTYEEYAKRFRYFLSWCDDREDVDPWDPERNDLANWTDHMNGNRSVQDINNRLTGVRNAYKVLMRQNVVDGDSEEHEIFEFSISDEVQKAKGGVPTQREVAANEAGPRVQYETISPEEYQKLLENVNHPRFRNQLICKMMWQLQLRSEEITTIKLDHIYDDENLIVIKDAKKNSADDDLWYDNYYKDDLQFMLDEWRDKRREDLAPAMAEESDYLLLSHQSPKLKPSTVTGIVREAAKNAGINVKMTTDAKGDTRWMVSSHTLRRSSATYIANKTDYPLHMLADDLNHRSVDTTRDRYVRTDDEERRKRRQSIDEL